ncbi:uncharacterized protein LOC110227671 isoform X2 [Arabidopsis lyrata subsp. lyrata]|uniref:uncharacterized protein LOC110227671 isoform X2 n=1 Tax=Arabidopsis lyrata subsp. lyrata TaxID=81972 RepID=UPI000A29C5B6|nr:uncharacterized protein LOC110227671 isoform X2 [Arabidopsis lyrata subsp. lyrata]|eukprot:XP_020878441.1 uncharacterized protein LOC110227671 isoform X2 [Arabidopsis lyrata subsp. lyrata]
MSPPSFFHREIFSRFLARLPLQPASAPTVVLIHSDFNPSHGLELLNTIAATLVASSLTQGFIAYISSRRLQPSLHWCLLSCSASATEFSLLVWHFTASLHLPMSSGPLKAPLSSFSSPLSDELHLFLFFFSQVRILLVSFSPSFSGSKDNYSSDTMLTFSHSLYFSHSFTVSLSLERKNKNHYSLIVYIVLMDHKDTFLTRHTHIHIVVLSPLATLHSLRFETILLCIITLRLEPNLQARNDYTLHNNNSTLL